MFQRPGRVALLAGGLALALGAAVLAKDESALPAAVKRLLDCRLVAADPARLACYDAAAVELAGLLTKGEIVAVDKDQVRKVRRQAFGFKLPSLNILERSDKPEEIEQIFATVTEAHQRADQTWVVTLDDGAVWSQVDREKLSKYPRKGSKAEVRRASLGTYFLRLDGQTAIRAKRVE